MGWPGTSLGSWNAAYPAVYPLDLSGLHVVGDYTVDVAGVTGASATIRVAKQAELGPPQLRDFAAFFQAQRDGADVVAGPLQRKPSHLRDAKATVYDWPTYEDPDSDVIVGNELHPVAGPVNVAGGWFDAGDFIKFAHTTAYADTLLLLDATPVRSRDAAESEGRRSASDCAGCTRRGTRSTTPSTSRSASARATSPARSTATTTSGGCRSATTSSRARPTAICATDRSSQPTRDPESSHRTWPAGWPQRSLSRHRWMPGPTPPARLESCGRRRRSSAGPRHTTCDPKTS